MTNRRNDEGRGDWATWGGAGGKKKGHLEMSRDWRRGPDSNRCIRILQTLALPLGYHADLCQGM